MEGYIKTEESGEKVGKRWDIKAHKAGGIVTEQTCPCTTIHSPTNPQKHLKCRYAATSNRLAVTQLSSHIVHQWKPGMLTTHMGRGGCWCLPWV